MTLRRLLPVALASACAMPAAPTTTRFVVTVTHIGGPGTWLNQAGDDVVLALAPGVYAATDTPEDVFATGSPASDALQALAETGDPTGMLADLAAAPDTPTYGTLSDEDELDYEVAPILPGATVTVSFDATGRRLVMAMMLGASNDTFLATPDDGLPLDGSADVTSTLRWLDAGTEVNEPLGEGIWQPASTPGVNQGPREDGLIHVAAEARVPAVEDVVRVMVEPVEPWMANRTPASSAR